MKIQINKDWRIESDPLNVTLYERKINKSEKSKNFGQERWEEQGNYGNLEQAYNGYLKRNALRSDSTEFKELIDVIHELEAYIHESVGGITASDMAMLDKIKKDRLSKRKEKRNE